MHVKINALPPLPHCGRGDYFAEYLILPGEPNLTIESDPRSDDLVQPFRIDPFALRGRLVRLGPTVERILSQHDYPEPVAAATGEAQTTAPPPTGGQLHR